MTTRKNVIDGKGAGLDAFNLGSSGHKHAAWRCLLAGVLAALVSSCAITKDYQPPQVDIPPAWRVDYQAAADLANTAWWEAFQDPVLDRLIEAALEKNLDLRIATARVEETAARIQAARSEFWPQIGYGASASRRQNSEELIYPFGTLVDRTNSRYDGFLNASWELDVWGRIRRSSEAARAEYLATEEARQAVILTIVSAVAGGYLELLSLDRQLQIARDTTDYRRDYFDLFEKKRRGGQISQLELIQVQQAYEEAATKIPMLEMRIAMQENAISVLLGRDPGPIERGQTLYTLEMPAVPEGIPSDILLRRPDIRGTEENLIAANARIGVARTMYFPSISLTALFGYASSDLSDLAKSSANIWDVGGGILGPLFTGGLIKSEIAQAEARYTQLLNEYLLTIKTALKEVNDALVSRQKIDELLQEQTQLVRTLTDYAEFSRKSFDAGFSGYLTVLDAQDKLYIAQIKEAQTRSDLLVALTNIYKAMGGGWVAEADKLTVGPDQLSEQTATKK